MTGRFWRKRLSRRALRQANAARDAGLWSAAASHYRRVLDHRPDDFAIWVQLGHMLAESDDWAGADQAYRSAHDIKADDSDLALCRGHLARRMGDIESAVAFYRESFALDGNGHAARAIEELASAEDRPCGGLLEGWYEREISGILHEAGDVRPRIEFRAGGRLVGQAVPERREDGVLAFRAVLDIDLGEEGEGVEVTAYRMPDKAPLDPGPVMMFPPSRHPADHKVAWSVPAEIVKPLTLPAAGEIALFVTHSRTGKIKPHVLPYLRALKEAGLAVFLVATVDRPVDLPSDLVDLADAVLVRRNAGYDFGAWSHALKLDPRLYGASILYLVNDSVLPAADSGRIRAIVDRIRRSDADLVGLTESHEWRWHVQS